MTIAYHGSIIFVRLSGLIGSWPIGQGLRKALAKVLAKALAGTLAKALASQDLRAPSGDHRVGVPPRLICLECHFMFVCDDWRLENGDANDKK